MLQPKQSFEIVELPSGGKSLRSLLHKETFHPGIGPMEEARILHIEQQELLRRSREVKKFIIWDVGLGAAANALAAITALKGTNNNIEIHSFDISIEALEFALGEMESLPYLKPYESEIRILLRQYFVQFEGNIKWYFHLGDFREEMQKSIPQPHAIFYDPYSPGTNGEMWTLDHFLKLRSVVGNGCWLTTYTRSTAVRVTLLLAGFYVGIGSVIGMKAETTIATTNFGELKIPLNSHWLNRVRVSRNGAPRRGSQYNIAPINTEDLAFLAKLEQFQ